MSLIAGLVITCDLSFYFTLLGMAHLLNDTDGWFLVVPFVMGLAAGFSHALGDKRKKRYLPLVILPLCLLIVRTPLERLLLLPGAVYTYLYMLWNRRVIDYYYAFTRFRASFLVMMLVVMFVIFLNGQREWLKTLPFMFLYLVLSINLLRMLRHDEKTMRQRRFRVVNLLGTAGICGAGLVFSTGLAQRLFFAFVDLAWNNVLHPAANFAADALTWVLHGLHDILSVLPFGFSGEEYARDPINFESAQVIYNQPGGEIEKVTASPYLKYILSAVGIAIAALIVVTVIRLLSRQLERTRDNDLSDVREKLDKDPNGKKPREAGYFARRRDPALGVRYWYRRFLDAADAVYCHIAPSDTSLDVNQKAAPVFKNEEALSRLREIYLPARYSETKPTNEDAENAKRAYNAIRESRTR